MIISKTPLFIPKGTVIPAEIMYWIKANCKKLPEEPEIMKHDYDKYDLPEGFDILFGKGFRK